MNPSRIISYAKDDKRQKNYDWKMSYTFDRSAQENVILQHKFTYLSCNYKDKLSNACPADIKMLKYCTDVIQDSSRSEDKVKPTNADYGEEEARLDTHDSELIEQPVRIWDEYKKLVELSRLKPTSGSILQQELYNVTSLPKLRINSGIFKAKPWTTHHVKRSIIRMDVPKTVLVVDTNYVQFHNFELKKVYKKIVTLQNVSNVPARFQIQPRPYCSKFCVIINPIMENRSIVPPGMQLQLIILFRCDDIEEPEEMLILNVEHGRSLIIRLHGYRDPPILLGTCMLEQITCRRSDTHAKLMEQSWNKEMLSFDSIYSSTTVSTRSAITWSTMDNNFVGMTFDCKKCFVGEEVYIPVKFENVGGEGRFFIMSESDWFTMDIKDITNANVLELACFTVTPAYFSLKAKDEMMLHMHFFPQSYGIHVEKLYILCDNCTVLTTEIIGDGIMYEPNFIRISKPFEKVWPYERNIDKRAKYYVNLSKCVPDGIGQCVIFLSNISEVCINFKWQKRDAQNDENELNEGNYFPLELLHIKPDRGTFAPTSVHYFTINAEYKNLDPNYYVAILQLYVEDIPVNAISKISEMQTKNCIRRHRKCSASVDIWVADIEVWLQYMMNDESRTDESCEEMKRATEMSLNYDYLQREQEEVDEERETAHETEYTEKRSSTCQLVLDELFSHCDFINLKQFEPLWQERIISMGVIRPTRSLFIGVEETYILMLKNFTNNSLNYSWGEVNGLDLEKMKLCICPEKGEIPAGNVQKMQITFTPIKEGFVNSLFVPCFVGDSRKIIKLGIECSIEPLYVTFYLPSESEESLELSNFVRIEWRVDSLKHALDMAGKSKKYLNILDKYRRREERELMNTYLDQGEVLKDASAGPSTHEVAAEKSYTSTSTSEIIQMSSLMTQSEKYSQDIIPVFDKIFPFPQQPVVIEFLSLPLKTVKKKTFIMKNETSIPTSFWLRIKNFYPITCSCEGKMQEDRIKTIYKRVRGQSKRLIEETLDKVKQPESGVVIYVDPLNSEIGPFQAIPIDVYVFADTWGIYVDEFEINITGLPQYVIGICVQAIGSPISISISDKNEFNIPVVKYGIQAVGTRLEDRKIMLKNTSVVPIVIDWHTFIVKPSTQAMPFNVAFDICTPFTDRLASNMRTSKEKSNSEMHLEKHTNIQKKFRNLHTCDSMEISNVTDSTFSCLGSSNMVMSWISHNENSNETGVSLEYSSKDFVNKNDSEYLQDNLHQHSDVINETDSEEKKEIDFKFSILPYYGVIDTKICTVTPREMFILPKDNASLNISMHYEKYKTMYDMNDALEGEFLCKILGLLRIAPSDMYKDNYYARQIGYYISPIEIDINANIIKPRLYFDISKFDRTYTCCASDVMLSQKKRLKLTKTFFLYNTENTAIQIDLETYDPFHISSVSLYHYANTCKPGIICVNAKGCIEVEIMCIIQARLIETIMHTSSNEKWHDSKISLTEPLYILHSDKSYQVVELNLQIWLPILKLSLYTLDFGTVYIGDTKKLTLTIKNLSICGLKFTLNKKSQNDDFMPDQNQGELSGYCVNEKWYSTITITFQPKKPGQSVETLEIIPDIAYNIEECQLCGEGTLHEKYHTPGV